MAQGNVTQHEVKTSAFYRGAGNFSGSDEFVLEVGLPGRKQLQRFRVNVSGAPGGGQNI